MRYDSPRKSQISYHTKVRIEAICIEGGRPVLKYSRKNHEGQKTLKYVGNKELAELQTEFKVGKSYELPTDMKLTICTTQSEYLRWKK